MDQKPELILSGDGSHSIVSSVFNTAYHSRHGAVTESRVVFIAAALDYLLGKGYKSIDVFEMGFGTGLNAVLAQKWAEEHQTQINYHTVEAFPVNYEVIWDLNYGMLLQCEDTLEQLHTCTWDSEHTISTYFTFVKWQNRIEDLDIRQSFDAVFYDAFAPATQPELWQVPVLSKVYAWMRQGSVLTSFCAQGAFKRTLKEVGLTVESIPGPPGKREMTRAVKH